MIRFLGIIFFCLFITLSAFPSEGLELNQVQLNLLSKLQSEGLLSIEPNYNKASIDPTLWNSMKYSLKEDVAAALAIYCGNVKGTQLYWVEIHDLYSGKKLAKYSQTWGFEVY